MRHLLVVILVGLSCTGVQAEQRVFGLDGSVYHLRDDGTYVQLPTAATEGRINFHFTAAQTIRGDECELRLALTNSTDKSIRYLHQSFRVSTRRDNTYETFSFGGGLQSQSVNPGEIAEDEAIFRYGACDQITVIEPVRLNGGQNPANLHVDGMAPFDVRKLFNYPDIGVFEISMDEE